MEASHSNMLAIIEQTDSEKNCYMDNTNQFLMLIILKVCLDVGTMFICYSGPFLSFLNLSSISIILADFLLAVFMSATLRLDVYASHTALCSIMAHFSAVYSALPVPMLCLGVLDYYLQDKWANRTDIKLVRNPFLVLLMWTMAGIYSYAAVNPAMQEKENKLRYLVCEIQESQVVGYSVVALTTLMFFLLVPYLLMIPRWVKEADRISKAREEITKAKTSEQLTSVTVDYITCTKQDFAMQRPSMHISLILGFGVFWMPYLIVTTSCVLFEFGVPAYVSVCVLWVQCVNSLLAGTVFWLRSDTVGPNSSLPGNVCLWQAYWHLSTGTEAHQQLSATEFNPSKGTRAMPFYV